MHWESSWCVLFGLVIYKRWSYCICLKSSYCCSTLLAYLPSSTRSTAPSPLVQPNPLSLALSLLRIRMKVKKSLSLFWHSFIFVPVKNGDSIASEGKGDYMFVEGCVVDLRGNPIPHATIDTWETDGDGFYDLQVREQITFRVLLCTFFFKKKQHFDSMTQKRSLNLNVEDGSTQPKTVHMHSVRLCKLLILNHPLND